MLAKRVDALWQRGRPAVMGVLNVTPDSFSDGGRYAAPAAALARAEAMAAAGADVIDVGGESTRPGAEAVPADVEKQRVVPVILALADRLPGVLLSVDTSKPEVAEAAVDAGAVLVNDVSAGRDPEMLPMIARKGAAVVLMHMRGDPRTMQHDTGYTDVVGEVHGFLAARADAARAAGLTAGGILLDPGIGFGKDVDGNLRLLVALGDLAALGYPLVVGASRKSFIGRLTGTEVGSRIAGSLAAIAGTVGLPRAVVRVHDVAETVQFLTVLTALRGAA
ncbi:MAG: dihydropteroate synthase [Acidobacteriota bacterium]